MKPSALILDDSLTVRMDLKAAFDSAGFETTTCSTVALARTALEEQLYAVIVLDVLLPDGDGVDFLAEIRRKKRTANIPVLLLSTEAQVQVQDRIRGIRTGADEYVGKPYDLAYVIARAKEVLRRHAPQDVGTEARPTVLVIDDSLTFRELLREGLEGAGYAVTTASTGEEGLRLAADSRPSAILVDGIMPGVDGATVVRRLRLDAVLRRTPCMLLTAAADRSSELLALDSGADAFVRKDEDTAVILARLGAILRGSKASTDGDDSPSSTGPKKILAVDDSPTYLHALAAQLTHEGYDVVLARSGEEALDLLVVQTVDCILMDLMMPGLSGQETCRLIKGSPATRDIPLMMLTALEERGAMLEGIRAGADDYISKSADFELLSARLRAQLRRRQFEDENRRIREKVLLREMDAAEARATRALADARATLLTELEHKNAELQAARRRLEETLEATLTAKAAADEANRELESFSYSVSHDLRAPLRAIDSFSRILLEDCADSLSDKGKEYLDLVRQSAHHMNQLIEDLLALARVARTNLHRDDVDLTALVRHLTNRLQSGRPERTVCFAVEDGVVARGDARLLAILFENLLGNAWKFTSKQPNAEVVFGVEEQEGLRTYFIRDNGAGFDMQHASKLFGAFQRLHTTGEFEGTGIGLAIVQRVVHRHEGRVWAQGKVGDGATFYFTLGERHRPISVSSALAAPERRP
jgi:two-component system, NtrC family, sensor kinase